MKIRELAKMLNDVSEHYGDLEVKVSAEDNVKRYDVTGFVWETGDGCILIDYGTLY